LQNLNHHFQRIVCFQWILGLALVQVGAKSQMSPR
jgi:hypothetical protein